MPKSSNPQKPIFDVKTRDKGLPAKSFIYIITIDYYLRIMMSILSHTEYFNNFIASKIKYKFKLKHRENTVHQFVNFMCTYDESRIDFLIPSKFIQRTDIIELITSVYTSFKKLDELTSKEVLSNEEKSYILYTRLRYKQLFDSIKVNTYDIFHKIQNIQKILVNHYISFIIKGLMLRRKGESNPVSLTSDAYIVLTEMINNYNYRRSKIPFNNYLKYFIQTGKDIIIKRELWDLKDGSLVSLDALEDLNNDNEDKKRDGGKVSKSDQLSLLIKQNMQAGGSFEEELALVEAISDSLPKPFSKVLTLTFGLIDPLTAQEEIELLLSNKD